MKTYDLYPITFIIVSAISTVAIDDLVSNIPTTLVLFAVTSIAIIYFHLINYNKLPNIYRTVRANPKTSLIVNVLLAITWFSTYVGIHYLGASVYNILYFSISAALASFINDKRNGGITLVLLLILLLFTWLLTDIPILGILFSFLGGGCGFLYRKYSSQLSSEGKRTREART